MDMIFALNAGINSLNGKMSKKMNMILMYIMILVVKNVGKD